jgi:hypothetical protein
MSAKTASRPALLIGAALIVALIALPAAAAAGKRDRNHDRIPDRWEKRHNLSLKFDQRRRDQDRDGLRNRSEWRADTNPHDADTDGDGVEDGDEDRDRDEVDNENEEVEHTSPGDSDSDDDGSPDGEEDREHDGLDNAGEDASGNHPVDADTDDDGVEDGDENAGVVASYNADTHRLTIELFNGESVTGWVTEQTAIVCQSESEHESGDESVGHDLPAGAASEEPPPPPDETPPGEEPGCSREHLVPGTIVHEAELKPTGDGVVFVEIELVR